MTAGGDGGGVCCEGFDTVLSGPQGQCAAHTPAPCLPQTQYSETLLIRTHLKLNPS